MGQDIETKGKQEADVVEVDENAVAEQPNCRNTITCYSDGKIG